MGTTSEILASARIDPMVALQEQHLDFIRQTDPKLPFVEQIGLRTETDRFEWQRQEYLARVNVNGFREIRSQSRYQAAGRTVAETRQRVLLHQALLERYEIILQLRSIREERSLLERLQQVFADKIQVLQKRAALNADADIDELIKAEYDRDALTLQLADLEQRQGQLRSYLQELIPDLGTDWQLDTSGFLPPEQLGRVASGLPEAPASNPEVLEKEAKIARIYADYQLEKAQGQQVLDFVQLRHQNRQNEPFARDLSIGLGINLPYKGSSRYKMDVLKIEQHAAALDLGQEQLAIGREIRDARIRLAALEKQYELARLQMNDSQAQYTLQQASRTDNPLVLLRAAELQLKRELRLLELEEGLYEQYLNILDRSGQLSASPAVNYLSATLDSY